MSTQTWTPKITGLAGEVTLTLPNDQWMQMPAANAKALGRKLIAEAMRAEGQHPGHLLIMETGE